MPPKNSNLQKAMAAGSAMSGALLLCGGIGYFLSNKYDQQLYLLIGLLLGVAVGMYEIYKQIK